MSISSMTNVAIARRTDFPPEGRTPQTMTEIAEAASGASGSQSAVTAALAVIVAYIPTEVLTLYVAVLAAFQSPQGTSSSAVWSIFLCFLIATPIIVWSVYAAKVKSKGKPLPLPPSQWPVWEMVAAIISYIAWAFSLPNAPFLVSIGLPATLGAIIVLVTAAILGLLAPILQRPINP